MDKIKKKRTITFFLVLWSDLHSNIIYMVFRRAVSTFSFCFDIAVGNLNNFKHPPHEYSKSQNALWNSLLPFCKKLYLLLFSDSIMVALFYISISLSSLMSHISQQTYFPYILHRLLSVFRSAVIDIFAVSFSPHSLKEASTQLKLMFPIVCCC